MTKQERAVRTRAAFIRAAAELFDVNGYHITSLAQVCRRAGLSSGAMMFHFPSKQELADSVEAEGRSRLAAALGSREEAATGPPLQSVVRLSVAFAELVETDCAVRASLALARDRGHCDPLSDLWLPVIGEQIGQASAQGHLPGGVSEDDVRALAEHLTRGAVACRTAHLVAGHTRQDTATDVLAQLWKAVLPALSAPAAPLARAGEEHPLPS
ncbi:TetR family transcriptional regulator [Streptomyces sp. NPDC005930]|uniref:TetR family transcriptional regulator n=1 Tax=Streptomyces sp. NPDC005930 TaxID=3364736 RepID=UPI0036AE1E28